MKKQLTWKITLPLGFGLLLLANIIGTDNSVAAFLGLLGLIVFVLGLVSGLIALVKYSKNRAKK